MTGSSPQAPGFINCTPPACAAPFTGLLPILAPDIRWNEGVISAVTFIVPEAQSSATRAGPRRSPARRSPTAWVVQNVVVAALSRMVAGVPNIATEGQAVTKGHMWC